MHKYPERDLSAHSELLCTSTAPIRAFFCKSISEEEVLLVFNLQCYKHRNYSVTCFSAAARFLTDR